MRRYQLQSKKHVWGLPVGKHVMMAAKVDGKLVMRAYTPISTNEELGTFRLLIKTYFKVRPACRHFKDPILLLP